MGKLKKFAIGSGITLVVLSGLTTIWYRGHYTMPPANEEKLTYDSIQGFEALLKATKLTVHELNGIALRPKPVQRADYSSYYPEQPLAGRLKLVAANRAAIDKTREVFHRPYHFPPHNTDTKVGKPLRDQANMLIFAGEAYADSGNLPEAARCTLDAIELGVTISHGGGTMPFLWGNACENMGRAGLDRLLEKLDATTARNAANRLARIEKKRTPLPYILYQQNHVSYHELETFFTGSPLTTWKNTGKYFGRSYSVVADFTSDILGEEKPDPPSLAERASEWTRVGLLQVAITYQGPGPTIEKMSRWTDAVVAQSKLPWGPQRPTLQEPGGSVSALFSGSSLQHAEFKDRQARTRLALLQTRIRLRATLLETGHYPDKLESLPEDPFSPDNSPLKYRSDGKTFTLWSVGPDATDDSGKPMNPKNHNWQRQEGYELGDVVAGINS